MAADDEEMTDSELRDALREIDDDDNQDVTTFEADFINSVCFKNASRHLSDKQREVARQIIEKYG